MRIRKRKAEEVNLPPVQLSSSSAGTLQRKDCNDGLEIGSEIFELTSGGEAAALSLVLLAAEAVPHAPQVQEYKMRQNYYLADIDDGATRDNQSYKVDSMSRKEKLDTSSNAKAASEQSTSKKGRKPQHSDSDSNSTHETGSYSSSSSEGKLRSVRDGEVQEILNPTVSEFDEGFTHPCSQLKGGSLTHSLFSIFSELPRNIGLSAREALSKIQEKGLPGLIEGDGVPSVQVAKIMRSNPYFVPVRGGKYLFTRLPDSIDFERYEMVPDSKDDIQGFREATNTGVGYGRISSSPKTVILLKRGGVTRTLKPASQVVNNGTRCTRVDGRRWQCHRTSLPGFSLCEHHHQQLSSQSRRQRNFQRAFNHSSRSRTRLRKREKKADAKKEGMEGNRTSTTESGRRKVVKARSLEAIVRGTVDVSSGNNSTSIS